MTPKPHAALSPLKIQISLCKLTIYKSNFSACAALLLFGLSAAIATAQILPPMNLVTWNGNGDGTTWSDSGNWPGGSPPGNTANALFPALSSAEQAEIKLGGDRSLRSLWFNAGTFYKFTGGTLTLGQQNDLNPYLLVVNSGKDANGIPLRQSEHNIEGNLAIASGITGYGMIRNYSEGGLGIGGEFRMGDRNIEFSGTGAIRLGGSITSADGSSGASGSIRVKGSSGDGSTFENVHLVLSGNNTNWRGSLKAEERGFVIIKRDQALGRSGAKEVDLGGTLALRSNLENPLTYNAPTQQPNMAITLRGDGIVRNQDTPVIGALYNDGGKNTLKVKVTLSPPDEELGTSFGARADRAGGLYLDNQVSGTGSFVKVHAGLVVLNHGGSGSGAKASTWTRATIIRDGVLRLGTTTAIPDTSPLVLDGGILELGAGDFNRDLESSTGGSSSGKMEWIGSGGFSAHGGNREAKISSNAPLTWSSTEAFLGDGHALLLSSRYADSIITLTNAINLNNGLREVRVERGDFRAGVAAHAVLSGALTSSVTDPGGIVSPTPGGLIKTGIGLLRLTGANTYTGPTEIAGGALRGAIPAASNIVLSGGVLGLDADFTRSVGNVTGQIRWDGSGGFAAYGGGDRTLQLGGNSDTINWGDAHFIQDDAELRFGHYSADGTVVWHEDKKFALGDGEHTIRVERAEANRTNNRADVRFAGELTSATTATLYLVGDGRIDFTHANGGLLAHHIMVYGAELRLHGPGKIAITATNDEAPDYFLRYGGTLTLDSDQESSESNRIHNESDITLATGTLNLQAGNNTDLTEEIGDLIIDSGANTISISGVEYGKAELHAQNLLRDSTSRATLDVGFYPHNSGRPTTLRLTHSASGLALGRILPWGTTGDDWLTPTQDGSNHYLAALGTYTGNTGWNAASNVKTTAGGSALAIGSSRTINSLIMRRNLNLGSGISLTLSSGGLMSVGARTISGNGSITTSGLRPLYVHNSEQLTISGSTRFTGGMDVVKTRGGSLVLNSTGTHSIGDLYIHQGTVEVGPNSTISVRDRITIGDGAGTDRLILPSGVWQPIVKTGVGLPSITLRGTPYDSRGPEYGGDQAILQLGGNGPTYGEGTKLKLANLHIENRGTIDWRGGNVSYANILWIDELTFNDTNARLFMRNWYEYEDLFLVRRSTFNAALLNQIIFEGYNQNYNTTWKDYNADYIQITPFGIVPEPSTYGAIFGALTLGLAAYRKRRKNEEPTR